MKSWMLLLPMLLLYSCSSEVDDILGTWNFITRVEQGEVDERSEEYSWQIEFLPEGVLRFSDDSTRTALIRRTYRVLNDTIIIYTERMVFDGIVTDTSKYRFDVQEDVLLIEQSKLYYSRFVRADADEAAFTAAQAEPIPLLARNKTRDIRDYISCAQMIYWRPLQKDSTPYLLSIQLEPEQLNYNFDGKESRHYKMYVTSDSTLNVLWDYYVDFAWMDRADTALDRLLEAQGTLLPQPDKIFATYRLNNDSVISVHYNYPGWVNEVNVAADDSLFPILFFRRDD